MSEVLTFRESLTQKGYAPVPLGASPDDMRRVIDGFVEFMQLPPDIQDATYFDLGRGGIGDFGLKERGIDDKGERGRAPSLDRKIILHIGGTTQQHATATLGRNMPASMRRFLSESTELFWILQAAKHDALTQLDRSGGKLTDALMPRTLTNVDVLRMIAYLENGSELAKSHFDRSAGTLLAYESHPGLQATTGQNGLILDANEEYMTSLSAQLRPVEHVPFEAKYIIGAGWNRLPEELKEGNENIKLTYHNVVNNPRLTRFSAEIARIAMVLFNNPHDSIRNYTVPTEAETRPQKFYGLHTAEVLDAWQAIRDAEKILSKNQK